MSRCAEFSLIALLVLVTSCGGPAPEPAPLGNGRGARAGAPTPATLGLSPTLRKSLDDLERRIQRSVDPARLSEALKALAARPHHAGSVHDLKSAEYVHRHFIAAGLESRIEAYEVLLPRPLEVTVELLSPVAYRCSMAEKALDEDFDTHTDLALSPFLSFAADGDVTGRLVYVNQATQADFRTLGTMGLTLRGAIGVARYGGPHPGTKLRNAEEVGLSALILYSDPKDDGYMRGDVYPKGPWRPGTAVRRDTVLDLAQRPGDPLTPGAPAFRNAERLPADDAQSMPRIPAAALSWKDAQPLLETMEGPVVPEGWQGGLPFPYHVGGSPQVTAHVRVTCDWSIRKIWNVVAHLRGSLFPDQWVVLGSHRDAWVHGASDGGSGTAVMLEAARVLGTLARAGHPPTRSIVFCSFDGEEYGSLGSVEHVEHFQKRLHDRCALYVNVDTAVSGPELSVTGSPELRWLIRGALEATGDPRTDPPQSLLRSTAVDLSPPEGMGGYGPFLHRLCVPVLDVASRGPRGISHSLYDTYAWMKRYGDPGFHSHARTTRLIALLLHRAATATIHPLDFAELARWIDREIANLPRHTTLDVRSLTEASIQLSDAGQRMDVARGAVCDTDPDPARLGLINRTLGGLARTLIHDGLLRDRLFYRNPLVAMDRRDGRTTLTLPAVSEALRRNDRDGAQAAINELAARVRRLAARVAGTSETLERLAR